MTTKSRTSSHSSSTAGAIRAGASMQPTLLRRARRTRRHLSRMRRLLLALALIPALAVADADSYASIPGGDFRSALKYEDTDGHVRVMPFLLMKHPVTNAEFLDFVGAHPAWRRDNTAPIFAERSY